MRKKLRSWIKFWRWYRKHRWNSVLNMQASWKRSITKDLSDQDDEVLHSTSRYPNLTADRNNAIPPEAYDLLYPFNPGGSQKTLTSDKTVTVYRLGQYHKRYSHAKKNRFCASIKSPKL